MIRIGFLSVGINGCPAKDCEDFPLLISVADAKYDHAIAQQVFLTEAIKDLLKLKLTSSEQVASGVVTNSEGTLS